jgi:hypothetical protein
MTIHHIINPVKVGPQSDLYEAQPVTFESMRRAAEYAAPACKVRLLSTQYPEDHEIIPEWFVKTPDLTRSVLDMGTFKLQRKLPLVADLLERAAEQAGEEDYLIYTNSDIALMPYFYLFVNEQINNGHDAFVINRRTIAPRSNYKSVFEMYADPGKEHPGFDCFVFKKAKFCDFNLGRVCIGTTKIGITVLANLMLNSINFKLIDAAHLTFHLGEDKIWQSTELDDYVMHNVSEAYNIYRELRNRDSLRFDSFELLLKHYHLLEKFMLDKGNSEQAIRKEPCIQDGKREKFFGLLKRRKL